MSLLWEEGRTGVTEVAHTWSELDLEIIRNKFSAITAEMGLTLISASQSWQVAEERDCAVAILDPDRRVAFLDNPIQLAAVARTAATIIEYFEFDMKDGDVVLASHPYRGGSHLQDVTLLAPLVIESEVLLYLVARAHMADMGGEVAHGYDPNATELWAEGPPLPPVKIERQGKPVRDIRTSILMNTRVPDETRRNLEAMMATLAQGARRAHELLETYGFEAMSEGMAYAQRYTERRARSAISTWRPGSYEGSAVLDHDATGVDDVSVRVQATVDADGLQLDFSGSDPERTSFVNSTLSNTEGAAIVPLLLLLGPDVPANSGLLEVVSVSCEPGRITNATFPKPVGWSPTHCGGEIAEATAAALAQALPRPCGAVGTPRLLFLARPESDRHAQLDLGRWFITGAPASAGQDGWGRPATQARSILPSIERWEATSAVRVNRLEFLCDSAGPGQWPGGPGVEVVVDLPSGYVGTLCLEGRVHTSPGSTGGLPGAPAELLFEEPDGKTRPGPLVQTEETLPTVRVCIRAGGGGGYGDPTLRDPTAVREALMDELLSPDAVSDVYGVVLAEDGSIDHAATEVKRSGQRGPRG